LPEEIEWKAFSAFPPTARLAVVVGEPSALGPYGDQSQNPRGREGDATHSPGGSVYTVICGVFYIGLGESFDGDKLRAYPPGSVIVLPGNTFHNRWAKSRRITYKQLIGSEIRSETTV
jgi:hypothetical protein